MVAEDILEDPIMDEVEDGQDGPILKDLETAANFLAKRSGDDQLLSRIESAVIANDVMLGTSEAVKGFVKALAVPQEDEGYAEAESVAMNFEGCMQVVLSLIKDCCSMDASLLQEMAEGLCAGRDFGDMRLRSLALLYNFIPESNVDLRYKVLCLMIDHSAKIQKVDKMETVFADLDNIIKGFNLNVADARILYDKVCDALHSTGSVGSAYTFNVKRLETYNGSSPEELQTIEKYAVQAVCDAIKLPTLFRFDSLLDLDAVEYLKQTEDNSILHELLVIFIKHSLAQYREFYGKNRTIIEAFGIDHDECIYKMRLLTFASLGMRYRSLKYDAIVQALEVPEEDVEKWVIQANSSGLVDTKMNQMERIVTVNRSTSRLFESSMWKPLSERINLWRNNLEELLETFRAAKRESL